MNKIVNFTSVVRFLLLARFQLSLQTTPCCMSHHYEVTLIELGGTLHDNSTTPVIADGYLAMVYDYDLKRTWVNNYGLHASVTLNVTIITHYDEECRKDAHFVNFTWSRHDNDTYRYGECPAKSPLTHADIQGKQYILSLGTCFFRSVRLDAMQKPCIPEHFILESTLTLGSTTGGIPIQRWRGIINGMTSVFTIDPSNCTPIAQSLYGTEASLDKQEHEFVNYIFTGYKPQVKSPHIFDFPSQCRNAKPLPGKRALVAEKILSKLPLIFGKPLPL